MAVFECKMCGGTLDISGNEKVVECDYCGTKQTLPNLDNEKRLRLFNRASHFRQNCAFDKAAQIYESIVQETPDDAEAHWSLVLCRYGIEYVEDPSTFDRIPTCHRASFDSILNDVDYLEAVRKADPVAVDLYKKEASKIDRIQKDILAVSSREKPFDVFICYKETDDRKQRTLDSVKAQEIYDALTDKGYKVFFSRITLEDKLGQEYEPYIFAALNSAKVMLVIGTRPEHFNAVWVRNEWGRYLKIMAKEKGRVLIPCYLNMDAYDLPEEFKNLQGQDMSKIGFLQDLVRGIGKIIPKQTSQTAPQGVETSIDLLIKRIDFFLEMGEFDRAGQTCDAILASDPENSRAYFGKFMVDFNLTSTDKLNAWDIDKYEGNKNYSIAFRLAKNDDADYLNSLIDPLKAFSGDSTKQYEYAKICEKYEKYGEALKWYQKSAVQGNADAQSRLGYMYKNGFCVRQDLAKALEWYLKAAEQGNANAQLQLGLLYENGRGVTQDYTKAVEWYRKSAEQGNAIAQFHLGTMYENGRGIAKDYLKALEWYHPSARQQNADALYRIGFMYEHGRHVVQDDKQAAEYYQRAAVLGHICAQYNMGVMYEAGRGVTRDYEKAMEWYQKAAEQGNTDAKARIGLMYENGRGVPQNYTKAVSWYQKSAEEGNAFAQFQTGYMYENGRGVIKDDAKAAEWYQKAAEQGNADAQARLGLMCEEGRGVRKDPAKAAEWYQKAAVQGNAEAQNNLGTMFYYGRGVKQDYAKAAEWYQKAAEQGHEWGQYHLGFMYENGQGVAKDHSKALEWYIKAAEKGNVDAQNILGDVYQVTQDYELAESWYRTAVEQGNADAKTKLEAMWRKRGRCLFCGGRFTGVFKKTCSTCGRLKNFSENPS